MTKVVTTKQVLGGGGESPVPLPQDSFYSQYSSSSQYSTSQPAPQYSSSQPAPAPGDRSSPYYASMPPYQPLTGYNGGGGGAEEEEPPIDSSHRYSPDPAPYHPAFSSYAPSSSAHPNEHAYHSLDYTRSPVPDESIDPGYQRLADATEPSYGPAAMFDQQFSYAR